MLQGDLVKLQRVMKCCATYTTVIKDGNIIVKPVCPSNQYSDKLFCLELARLVEKELKIGQLVEEALAGKKSQMSEKGIKLITYELTPLQVALIEWGKVHPYGRITIVFQDSVPVQALVPTKDGMGTETVLFEKVARQLGLIK